jgi:hypothetical protein
MFRRCSEPEYEELSEGGVRYLFQMDHLSFRDTLDGEGFLHFFVVEEADEPQFYESDQEVMYELMARFLAGEFEKAHYEMERSPTHAALMDVLELASARARAGDASFSFDHEMEDLEEEIGGDDLHEERG